MVLFNFSLFQRSGETAFQRSSALLNECLFDGVRSYDGLLLFPSRTVISEGISMVIYGSSCKRSSQSY